MMRKFGTLLAAALFCAFAASAQDPNSASSKTRADDVTGVRGAVQGVKPDKVLKTVKDSGIIRKVDLQARTVTIALSGQSEGIELAFAQPTGREQIKTSKKFAKETGKKKLELEELSVGAKVKFEYYTLLDQLMDLVVEGAS
jgi:hypothetical protein